MFNTRLVPRQTLRTKLNNGGYRWCAGVYISENNISPPTPSRCIYSISYRYDTPRFPLHALGLHLFLPLLYFFYSFDFNFDLIFPFYSFLRTFSPLFFSPFQHFPPQMTLAMVHPSGGRISQYTDSPDK
jgi:hypothetical protein